MQSFVNSSLELWGAPDTCYVNTAPDDWFDYSSGGGLGMDKIDFLLCPTTRPSNTTDGTNCGRMAGVSASSGEGMYQEILGFTSDTTYNISFDYVGSDYLSGFSGQNQIHLFIDDIDVGQTPIFNSTDSTWNSYNFNFTATQLTHKIGIRLYKISGSANAAVDNFKLLIQTPNEIKELATDNRRIKIYPNPNNGNFTIEHNLNGNNYVLEIVDVMGNTVHREILTNGNQQKIETKQLSSGIYFVKILNQQQQVSSHAKMSVVR
ncbi:MAG: T9SS type A sorting domain-containing protein [Flavobacteriales bacterium]|nr:T9SS type A sorting domain-containing protein [Flavobacteriales bacterium]